MAKYAELRKHLESAKVARVPMTFAEIERLVGHALPPSHRDRSWWSNNPNNSGLTRQWLAAGFRAEQVDVGGRRLTFRRPDSGDDEKTASADSVASRHPIFGALKGMVTIMPGTDLTAPLGEEWGTTIWPL
jgi:hypothetical protein